MGVERYLLGEERHVVMVRQHGIVLTRPVVEILLVLGAALVPTRGFADVVGTVLWVVVLGDALIRFARWRVQRFVVTDQRVLMIQGLLTRRVSMLPLRKVTDMTYRRTVLGRLLGYGEFVMESAGETQSLQRVQFLPSPDTLYLEISELLFAPRAVAPADVVEY